MSNTNATSCVSTVILRKRSTIKEHAESNNSPEPESKFCILPKAQQGKSGHGESPWSATHKLWLKVIMIVASLTRFFNISIPSETVFDEVHFGKFASYYIRGEYFFDVHPPLGKLIFAGIGKLFGYDGWFSFDKIGMSYFGSTVPYVALRSVSALCSVITVGVVYAMLVEMNYSIATCLVGTSLILFDNALVTQGRFILLDAQLICFMAVSCYSWIKFRKLTNEPFSFSWWSWLGVTGIFLGLSVGVKLVGLFAMATIGFCTICDLWDITSISKTPKLKTLLQHWTARIVCLIMIPIAVFILPYAIHFKALYKSGTGDEFHTPQFQSTLQGNLITATTYPIYYGSVVAIKSKVENIFLHSHAHNYPLRHLDGKVSSQGQQVTGYTADDHNNDWIIFPPLEDTEKLVSISDGRIPIKNGDLFRLMHVKTKKYLTTHDVASPLTVTNQEVTAVFIPDASDKNYPATIWKMEIKQGGSNELQSKISSFRMIHNLTGCALFNFQQNLPEWAFEQREINAVRNDNKQSWWYVEEIFPPGGWTPQEKKEHNLNSSNFKMGFWGKFFETFTLSIYYNSQLADSNPYMTSPYKWPFLTRGISFWNAIDKKSKVYLLGNIFTWYFSLASIPMYVVILLGYLFMKRRNSTFLTKGQESALISKGGFFLIAYCFNYLPFFLMGRSLYFHHYLPSYLFSTLIAASVFEIVSGWANCLRSNYFLIIAISTIFAVFSRLSPLAYALVKENEQAFYSMKWLKGWHFVN